MMRTLTIFVVLLSAAVTTVHATTPLLHFSFDKDPDYTIVIVTGPHRQDIATINEITFPNPVIYPAPDYNNAVIAAAVYQSKDFGDYDSIIYMRLRRSSGRQWTVFQCNSRGLYSVPNRNDVGEDGIAKIARAAFVRALKQGKPIPGETCEPAQEIQKGSRTY